MAEVKNKALLEIKKEDRVYEIVCPVNSNLGELFDVLCEARAWCVEKIQLAQKQQDEASKPPKEKVEPIEQEA